MSFKIEKSLRLDTFQADCPIILGNGEAFHFRPPRFLCYPTVNQDGRILMAMGGLNYGPELQGRGTQVLQHIVAIACQGTGDNAEVLSNMGYGEGL
jgi:hypothetical protein